MVEQKAKFKQKNKQKKAAPNFAEKTTMAAPKCATEKKIRHSCTKKRIDLY